MYICLGIFVTPEIVGADVYVCALVCVCVHEYILMNICIKWCVCVDMYIFIGIYVLFVGIRAPLCRVTPEKVEADMCVFVSVCVCVCICLHCHVCMYILVCVYMYMFACIYVCIRRYQGPIASCHAQDSRGYLECLCMCICMFIMYICIYSCVCVNMYISECMCIYSSASGPHFVLSCPR